MRGSHTRPANHIGSDLQSINWTCHQTGTCQEPATISTAGDSPWRMTVSIFVFLSSGFTRNLLMLTFVEFGWECHLSDIGIADRDAIRT